MGCVPSKKKVNQSTNKINIPKPPLDCSVLRTIPVVVVKSENESDLIYVPGLFQSLNSFRTHSPSLSEVYTLKSGQNSTSSILIETQCTWAGLPNNQNSNSFFNSVPFLESSFHLND